MFYVNVCWSGPYCSSKTLTDSDEQVLLFSSAFAAHEYMRTKHGALNSGVNEDGIERGDLPLDFEACYFLVKCKLFNSPAPKFVHMADPHTLRLAFEGDKYDGMTPADYGTDRP